MARYKDKAFTLYCRKLSGKSVWYYYAYGDNGNRLPGKSTGIGFTREKDKVKSRREAEAYCQQLLEMNMLSSDEIPTLEEWITKKHFWDWGKSEYVRKILARSEDGKPKISEGYCKHSSSITNNHIIPHHGRKKINQITPYDCERLLFIWKENSNVKNSTINIWKVVYSTILGEYEREQKMKDPKSTYFNPWRIVNPLGTKENKYGGLSMREVYDFLKKETIDFSKDNQLICYLATKIAFLTGLRIAEVIGLRTDDVRDEYIGSVRMSYLYVGEQFNSISMKRSLTKDKEIRMVPITASLRDEIEKVFSGPGNYLFSVKGHKGAPMSQGCLRQWFYRRLYAIGINEEERKTRNLTFHSTRRFFNTLLTQAKVDTKTIQRFTGHDSDEMTEHYTDYLPEDLQEISKAQDRFLIGKC